MCFSVITSGPVLGEFWRFTIMQSQLLVGPTDVLHMGACWMITLRHLCDAAPDKMAAEVRILNTL